MYDKRNQQWTVADEASSHSKEASAKDYIRVHVGGIAGKLVILPLASTHQLLYNDIEKGNMPETMYGILTCTTSLVYRTVRKT